MRIAPPTPDEEERLEKLHSTGLLDSAPEIPFDNAVRLASIVCQTPVALVSLVAEDRQWFKAKVGLETQEGGRDESFCSHALTRDSPLVVQDAVADERFADNPLVTGKPEIRFYAGVPLMIEGGSALGTLCVIDHVPRQLTQEQMQGLRILAKQVEDEIIARREFARRSQPPSTSVASRTESHIHVTLDSEAATLPISSQAEEPSELPARPGDLVGGRYVVQDLIGAGGMGLVMRASDLTSGATVALKILLNAALGEELRLDLFASEARTLRAFRSEHITSIFDVGNLPNGLPFIAMEFVNGQSLDRFLLERGDVDIDTARRILIQAATGVATAHGAGVVHRDLKPSNLMIVPTESGHLVKLLDFGIAKGPTEGDLIERMGAALVGTVHYMAPEQTLGASRADARSDVWSLGCIAYELLAGRPPFEGEDPMHVCARVLAGNYEPVRKLVPGVPLELASIVDKCLSRSPDDRFADAGALRAALSEL